MNKFIQYRFPFSVFLFIVLYECVKEEHINYLQIWQTKYVFNLCHHHDLLMTLPPPCSFSFHANILIILNIFNKISFTSPFLYRQWPEYCKSAKIGTFLWLIIMCLWAVRKLGIECKFGYGLIPFSTICSTNTNISSISTLAFSLCILKAKNIKWVHTMSERKSSGSMDTASWVVKIKP